MDQTHAVVGNLFEPESDVALLAGVALLQPEALLELLTPKERPFLEPEAFVLFSDLSLVGSQRIASSLKSLQSSLPVSPISLEQLFYAWCFYY